MVKSVKHEFKTESYVSSKLRQLIFFYIFFKLSVREHNIILLRLTEQLFL